jgi:hypothetical protein
VLLAAPGNRRQGTRWRRRNVGAEEPEEPEELAAESVGSEIEHPDPAARAADTHELVRDRLVVGREDRPERRGDDVELTVAEWERLGIRFDPVEVDSLRAGLAPAASKFSGA